MTMDKLHFVTNRSIKDIWALPMPHGAPLDPQERAAVIAETVTNWLAGNLLGFCEYETIAKNTSVKAIATKQRTDGKIAEIISRVMFGNIPYPMLWVFFVITDTSGKRHGITLDYSFLWQIAEQE